MHLMVTVLGCQKKISDYYYVEPKTGSKIETKAELAPLALVDIFEKIPEKRPDKILAICTDEALETTFDTLKNGIANKPGYSKDDVYFSKMDINVELEEFVTQVANEVKKFFTDNTDSDDYRISVDFTHGFRQFTVMTYSTVLYLAELYGYKFCGAYVCANKVYDLTHLSTMQNWVHAIRRFETEMDVSEIAGLIDNKSQEIQKNLKNFSSAFGLGLPLEAGFQSSKFLAEQKKHFIETLKALSIPEPETLNEKVRKVLSTIQLNIKYDQCNWKKCVELNETELLRQAEIINKMLKYQRTAEAIALMREWVISWVVLQQHEEKNPDWLDPKGCRQKAEGTLSRMKAFIKSDKNNEVTEYEELNLFWENLRELRNAFQHCGMRKEFIQSQGTETRIENVISYWNRKMSSCPKINLNFIKNDNYESVLIVPVGLNPWQAFALLSHWQKQNKAPDMCLFIASKQSEPLLEEIVAKSKFTGKWESLIVENAFGGEKTEKYLRSYIPTIETKTSGAKEFFVVINGGTPFMKMCIERFCQKNQNDELPIKKIIVQKSDHDTNKKYYEIPCNSFEI